MSESLEKIARRMGAAVDITITDHYVEKMEQYEAASRLRADARTIVTATVLLLSAAMLYLLRRSDVQGQIGMLSVYRLLGIPVKKTVGIFVLECVLNGLTTVLPAVAVVWAVVGVVRPGGLIFPWYAAVLVVIGILCFYVAITILPLRRLLKLPPARLAAKYDF